MACSQIPSRLRNVAHNCAMRTPGLVTGRLKNLHRSTNSEQSQKMTTSMFSEEGFHHSQEPNRGSYVMLCTELICLRNFLPPDATKVT